MRLTTNIYPRPSRSSRRRESRTVKFCSPALSLLRQNTEAVEAATFQSLTDASSNYLLTIASDAELTRINALGTVDAAALNGVDSDRLFILRRSYWVRMQNVFSQWNRGTLSDEFPNYINSCWNE